MNSEITRFINHLIYNEKLVCGNSVVANAILAAVDSKGSFCRSCNAKCFIHRAIDPRYAFIIMFDLFSESVVIIDSSEFKESKATSGFLNGGEANVVKLVTSESNPKS